MDLKNGQITLGALLDNPQSKAILQKRFGTLLSHPLLSTARSMSLSEIIKMGGKQLSPSLVKETIEELKRL